jgi:hypothetical protein
MKRVMRTLEDLAFDNVYLKLPAVFYNKINPTPVSNPYLVSFNSEAANLIDLDVQNVKDNEQSAVNYFSGNTLLKGSEPAAMAYAGYQFGYLNLLGDGRAILLGQVRNQNGELWDLHLKVFKLKSFNTSGKWTNRFILQRIRWKSSTSFNDTRILVF